MDFEANNTNINEDYTDEYVDDNEMFIDDEEVDQPFRDYIPNLPYMCYMCPMYYDNPMTPDDFYRGEMPFSRQYPLTLRIERCNHAERRCSVVIRVAGREVLRTSVRLVDGCTKASGEANLQVLPPTRVGIDGEICVNTRRREICFRGIVYKRVRGIVGCPRNCRWGWRRQILYRTTKCERYS